MSHSQLTELYGFIIVSCPSQYMKARRKMRHAPNRSQLEKIIIFSSQSNGIIRKVTG